MSDNVLDLDVGVSLDTGLTPPQEAAAKLLALGAGSMAIAETYKVSVRTVDRWRQLPAFIELVRGIREAIRHEAGGILHRSYKATMERVTTLVQSPDERIALTASKLAHDMLHGLHTLEELTIRLEKVEKKLAEKGQT